MTSHRRSRCIAAAMTAAICLPTSAFAVPAEHVGDTPAEFGQTAATSSPRIGDTPADFGRPVPATPKAGDTPADYPGASRAPQSTPLSKVEIVRPERTIVREVDAVLPIALSGAALLLAFGGLGIALLRTGTVVRPGRGH